MKPFRQFQKLLRPGLTRWFLAVSSLILVQQTALAQEDTCPPLTPLLVQIRSNWSNLSREQIRKAAEAGRAEAQYLYGANSLNDAFEERGHAYHQWPAQSPMSRAEMARMLATARTNWTGVSESDIRKAAEAGDIGAQRHISQRESAQAAKRALAAFEWLKRAAEQGVVPAEFTLAFYYLGKSGWRIVPGNTVEGLKWLRQAAEGGDERAQHLLAQTLMAGEILPPDLATGIEWLRKAADANCIRARYELAQQYSCGNGEPRNSGDTPIALLRAAARAGWSDAQFALAERLRTGLGTPQDYVEAIKWYRLAATAKRNPMDARLVSRSSAAEELLSLAAKYGEAAAADYARDKRFIDLLKIYIQAVDREDAVSAKSIGDLYRTGDGVEKNPAKAYFWYDHAASRGLAQAAQERDRLKAVLTADEIRRNTPWFEEFGPDKQAGSSIQDL